MAFRCFVGKLHPDINDVTLHKEFKVFGKVHEAKIVRERDTDKSKGFGFVTYADENAMKDAIRAMNGLSLNGRKIVVRQDEAQDGRKKGNNNGGIVVRIPEEAKFRCDIGNLNYGTDKNHLYRAFEKFGRILTAEIAQGYDKINKEKFSLGYGSVVYATAKAMWDAIDAMNGQELHGHRIIVRTDRKREASSGDGNDSKVASSGDANGNGSTVASSGVAKGKGSKVANGKGSKVSS